MLIQPSVQKSMVHCHKTGHHKNILNYTKMVLKDCRKIHGHTAQIIPRFQDKNLYKPIKPKERHDPNDRNKTPKF